MRAVLRPVRGRVHRPRGNPVTGPALVFAAALLITFAAAFVAAWLDDRRWLREFDADEPPSRLDSLDRGEDPWRS